MDSSLRIKKVSDESDMKIIETLAKDIWTQHYTAIIGKEQVDYMLDNFQSQHAIKRDIAIGYRYYLAYINDIACGYSSIKIDNGVFLSKFYVKQSCRGLGLGKAMMENIFLFAKQHNESRIWLTCNKHNPSIAVYKKMGFIVIDECVTDIDGGFVMDDYVLEKPL